MEKKCSVKKINIISNIQHRASWDKLKVPGSSDPKKSSHYNKSFILHSPFIIYLTSDPAISEQNIGSYSEFVFWQRMETKNTTLIAAHFLFSINLSDDPQQSE